MAKDNENIYLIGGAAVLAYFLFFNKKTVTPTNTAIVSTTTPGLTATAANTGLLASAGTSIASIIKAFTPSTPAVTPVTASSPVYTLPASNTLPDSWVSEDTGSYLNTDPTSGLETDMGDDTCDGCGGDAFLSGIGCPAKANSTVATSVSGMMGYVTGRGILSNEGLHIGCLMSE
jgi:hypothetical protein